MGLLDQAMSQPQERPIQGDQTPQGGQATSEEQDAKDRVVMAAMEMIYNDQADPQSGKTGSDGVVGMLQAGAEVPSATLPGVAAQIIMFLDEQSGWKIPDSVILPAAAEIMALLAELGEKSGAFQVDDQMVQEMGPILQNVLKTEYSKAPQSQMGQPQASQMGQPQTEQMGGQNAQGNIA